MCIFALPCGVDDVEFPFIVLRRHHSLVFAKNTSVRRIFGENSGKISAGGGILGKD